MAIPKIETYSLAELCIEVKNIAKWRHSSRRSLLLVHDMQRYFLDLLPQPLRSELVLNCQKLISHARQAGMPIVYTAQCGDMSKKERGLLYDIWGKGMSSRPEHTAIADEIIPQEDDVVLNKWRYSAFHATSLDKIFREQKRSQIVICGVYAHIGILATAIDAYSRDIEVFLTQDSLADFTRNDHMQALNYAARCCAVVLPTDEICP